MKTHKKPRLDPLEWDYRDVEKRELLIAIPYEYAREAPVLCNEIESWKKRPLSDFAQIKNLISMKSIQVELPENLENLLFWLKENPNHYRDPVMMDALKHTMSAWVKDRFAYLAILCPEFPKAWLQLNKHRRKHLVDLVHDKQIVPDQCLNPVFRFNNRALSIRSNEWMEFNKASGHYDLYVDWSCSKKQIKKAFLAWLHSMPSRVHDRLPKIANRYHAQSLRWLSALKLSRHYKYSEAQDLINQFTSGDGHHKDAILPTYSDQSAWKKAIGEARIRDEILFN